MWGVLHGVLKIDDDGISAQAEVLAEHLVGRGGDEVDRAAYGPGVTTRIYIQPQVAAERAVIPETRVDRRGKGGC